jgi:hypothetical protein
MIDGRRAINLLAKAFDDADPRAALRTALDRIAAWERDSDRAHDHFAFVSFLMEVLGNARSLSEGPKARLLYDAAALFVDRAVDETDSDSPFGGGRRTRWRTRPLHEWHEAWSAMRDMSRREDVREALLQSGGWTLATLSQNDELKAKAVTHVTPGEYRLVLETGLVLWCAHLDQRDLIWSHAYSDRALQLAAATSGAVTPATLETVVCDGLLKIRVFPGVEAGTIAISWLADGS